MKVIKETTLHPEGNDGVDLYPKTSITQVENLPNVLAGIDQTEQSLVVNKLDKPATPTAESAVVLGTDGAVNTKPLSEIGGGKLYLNSVFLQHTNFYLYMQIIWNKKFSTFNDLIEFCTGRQGIIGQYSGPNDSAPCVVFINSSGTSISGVSYFANSAVSIKQSVDNSTITFSNTSIEL